MTTRTTWGIRTALVLAVACVGVPALLACDEDKSKKVRVSVVVILASEKDKTVEKKLEDIATEVRKLHPKLTGFKSVSLSCRSLPVGTPEIFELVDNETATITVLRAADKKDRICLKVRPPMMRNITYSTPCGKFLPILTPLLTKDGEKVLIAVRVQPCNGK